MKKIIVVFAVVLLFTVSAYAVMENQIPYDGGGYKYGVSYNTGTLTLLDNVTGDGSPNGSANDLVFLTGDFGCVASKSNDNASRWGLIDIKYSIDGTTYVTNRSDNITASTLYFFDNVTRYIKASLSNQYDNTTGFTLKCSGVAR